MEYTSYSTVDDESFSSVAASACCNIRAGGSHSSRPSDTPAQASNGPSQLFSIKHSIQPTLSTPMARQVPRHDVMTHSMGRRKQSRQASVPFGKAYSSTKQAKYWSSPTKKRGPHAWAYSKNSSLPRRSHHSSKAPRSPFAHVSVPLFCIGGVVPIAGAPRSYGMEERKVADVLRWENICNATLPNENRREVYPTWRGNDE
mmetsp:Transcript_6139/g.14718  ORF Transcript_6139/g.14718 Transcript_6139/m.14718 type:complete len:201 (+) Transcript_6139:1202-1804(+)